MKIAKHPLHVQFDHVLALAVHVGGVLKSSEPAGFKTDTGFDNCPRFVGVIEQNKV